MIHVDRHCQAGLDPIRQKETRIDKNSKKHRRAPVAEMRKVYKLGYRRRVVLVKQKSRQRFA